MPKRRSGESSDADRSPFLYYLDWDSDRDSCEDPDFWQSDYVVKRKCPRWGGCGGIRPRFYGEPMRLHLARRPSLSIDAGYLCLLAHRRVFDTVKKFMCGYVAGPCVVGKRQSVLDEYVSYYAAASQSLHILYGPKARSRACSSCGRPTYAGGTVGQVAYILRSHIRGRHAHVEGVNGTFLITPWLAKRIDIWTLCKDVRLIEYPVLDEPLGIVPKLGAGPTNEEVARWRPGEFLWRHPRAASSVPPLPARATRRSG